MFVFKDKKGFTLIELMVAMAIATIVMAAIYSTYRSQLRSHITQQALVEMQQNARASMYVVERAIKSAGYDPDGTQATEISTAADNTIIFTTSAVSDGIDNDGDGDIDAADTDGGEVGTFTYSLVGQDLQRTVGATAPQPVAENIEVLDFVYLDENSNVLGPTPLSAANRDAIRSIQITLIARSGANVPVLMMKQTDHHTYTNQQGDILLADPDDNFRRIVLTADVQCRNLGL
jgi:type IV pilus assembly protein PilW